MIGLGGWDAGLRDASLETWSKPTTKPSQIEELHRRKTTVDNGRRPNLSAKEAVAFHAQTVEEEKKLAAICQKAPSDRTEEEVRCGASSHG